MLRQWHLSGMHTEVPSVSKSSWFEKVSTRDQIYVDEDDVKWFEKEMTFISAFFKKELLSLSSVIASKLDDLAEQVYDSIKQRNPSHPLLDSSLETLIRWNSVGFPNNLFDDEATREIFDCQCELFKEIGFKVQDEDEKEDLII